MCHTPLQTRRWRGIILQKRAIKTVNKTTYREPASSLIIKLKKIKQFKDVVERKTQPHKIKNSAATEELVWNWHVPKQVSEQVSGWGGDGGGGMKARRKKTLT